MLQKAGVEFANKICKNDPVRPNLPIGWRVAPCSREVFYLPFTYYSTSEDRYHESADAVLCVAHLNEIPINEDELLSFDYGNISIFYSVWSNRKGCGRKIILEVWDLFKKQHTGNRYVTMSPKTEMAMKFHLSNGAILLQENPETNNFEYK